jgi:hypothetical protein
VEGTVYPGAPFPPLPITDDGYPATTVPMGPSVVTGVINLATAVEYASELYFQQHGNSFDGLALFFTGYSQGAMVTAAYWRDYILNPQGAHHHLAPYVYRIYQFGDPYRAPNIAHGNALAGMTENITTDGTATGGIGGKLDLTAAQSNLLAPDGGFIYNSCANQGDIYTACPVGNDPWGKIAQAGKVGNLIFGMIQSPSFLNIIKIAGALAVPVGMVEEIINGIKFAAAGTNAPHWQYFTQMDACINDVLAVGKSLPHQLGF